MAIVFALLITFVLFFVSLIVGAVTHMPGTVMVAMVVITSIWAGVDASRIEAKKYQTGLAEGHPLGIVFGCLLLWIVVFPCYLVLRSRIRKGEAKFKPAFANEQPLKSVSPPAIPSPQRLPPTAGSAPAVANASNTLAQLEQLAKLKEGGMLTDAEFEREKRKILGTPVN